MDANDNPIIADQTHCLQPSQPQPRKPSARSKQAILRLGLRYRPLDQDKQEGFTAKLALLTADTIDVPPDLLERAAEDLARTSRFLPSAGELIERAKSFVAAPTGNRVDLCAKYNARLRSEGNNHLRWVETASGDMKLESI